MMYTRAMRSMVSHVTVLLLLSAPTLVWAQSQSDAQPLELSDAQMLASGMSFQGRLQDGGTPLTGLFDLQFTLYDALAAGAPVGSTVLVADLLVIDGLFTVELDFGNGLFGEILAGLRSASVPGPASQPMRYSRPARE